MNPEPNHIAFAAPLVAGLLMTLFNMVTHASGGITMLMLTQWHVVRGRAGMSISRDLPIVMISGMLFMCAHLIEITEWAALLLYLGEFHDFAMAFYHSAVNYTTLGYGDIVMNERWRLLGPLEATDGMLMFGLSAAMLFNLIMRLGQLRTPDHVLIADPDGTRAKAGKGR